MAGQTQSAAGTGEAGAWLSGVAVNCSILYGRRPAAEALARVHRAGFSAVEFWWPFATASPTDAEVAGFIGDIASSGLELVALNLFAGDMSAGDRGILSWPGYEQHFRASVRVARRIQQSTGCNIFNALYGRRRDGFDIEEQASCAVANLELACRELATAGGTVVLEPLSGVPDYPLQSGRDVMEVVDTVRERVDNVGMLLDVYHLWANGDDVEQVIDMYAPSISHVQLADAPGRCNPGSGKLPLLTWTDRLRSAGYSGRIALEYLSQDDDPLAGLRPRWAE